MSGVVDHDLLTNLGRSTRIARLHLGLTIEELAERADINVLLLDAIERREGGRLDMLGLQRLAVALERSPAELVSSAPSR